MRIVGGNLRGLKLADVGAGDPAAAFAAVDRVVQTGQDPRRFVDDLLERLRDLIVIAATGQGAAGRGSGCCRVQGPACLRGCRARLFPLDDDCRLAATGL